MIIFSKLVNLNKPTIVFQKNEKLKVGEEYFFEFEDFDYRLNNNSKKIKRKLEKFDKMIGFDIGTKLKGFLKLEYGKSYKIKIS
jgi:hypothetical protein